jgi:hypothetical protein
MNVVAKNIACIALACAPGLAAAAGAEMQLDAIARATGLTPSEVQMVVGARTPHPEYFTSFERSQRRMIQALGSQRYRDLMSGHEIVLDDGRRVALVQR